jgi:hypothetical protein
VVVGVMGVPLDLCNAWDLREDDPLTALNPIVLLMNPIVILTSKKKKRIHEGGGSFYFLEGEAY